MTSFEIRAARPADWQIAKAVRLRALADSPAAFGSTLARELVFDDAEWQARVAQGTWYLAWPSGSGSEPGTAVPDTAAPGTAARGTAVPGRAVPDTAVPDGTGPAEAGPGSSAVGMAATTTQGCRPDERHLVGMWVAPEHRGSTVAAQLVEAVCLAARTAGATAIVLWVADDNSRAARSYRRMGFVETGERAQLPSNSAVGAQRMRRTL